jgi:hypothetical protein
MPEKVQFERRYHLWLFTMAFALALSPWVSIYGEPRDEPWTLALDLNGEKVEGLPLRWSSSTVVLLGRDGTVWRFSPQEATNFRRVPGEFRGFEYAEMRGRLLREFNNGLEVSTTPHYFIVHPIGQSDRWTRRFEELYRSFVRYFEVRGVAIQAPKVPLVAVVFPNQAAYLNYAGRTEKGVSSQTLGYYSLTSNRIIMYDVEDLLGAGERWQSNAATIVHEAVHQAAFNTGVHDRATLPPRWVVEGLGTMFEAEGVWDSQGHPRQAARIHRNQLAACRHYREKRPAGLIPQIIASDRVFQVKPTLAYAESWAFTFFLVETRPAQYAEYLRKTTARERPLNPDSTKRLQEFTSVFGADLTLLEAHYLAYIDRL